MVKKCKKKAIVSNSIDPLFFMRYRLSKKSKQTSVAIYLTNIIKMNENDLKYCQHSKNLTRFSQNIG